MEHFEIAAGGGQAAHLPDEMRYPMDYVLETLSHALHGCQHNMRVFKLINDCFQTVFLWAEMLHHQGGQNQNWMPKPCLLRGPQVGRNPAFSGIPNKEDKVKTKKKPKKISHGVPDPAYSLAD